jgi:hypothetical protein
VPCPRACAASSMWAMTQVRVARVGSACRALGSNNSSVVCAARRGSC